MARRHDSGARQYSSHEVRHCLAFLALSIKIYHMVGSSLTRTGPPGGTGWHPESGCVRVDRRAGWEELYTSGVLELAHTSLQEPTVNISEILRASC